LVGGGGYAEYCAAPEGQCLPVPANLTLVEAASLPETFFTVWSNVFERGALKAGEALLVHGGSSGIGVAAIQLATARGAVVYVTAGSEEKCSFCEKLGAVRAINYKVEKFKAVIKELTQNRGVNVILDMIGGDYTPDNLDLLAEDGRLVMINFMKGEEAVIRLGPIMRRRLTLTGSTLRGRDTAFKAALAHRMEQNVWPLLAAGKVKPVVYKTFPMERAGEAHEVMESSRHIGKLVLLMSQG
jgi:NADPH2:quinone reductase